MGTNVVNPYAPKPWNNSTDHALIVRRKKRPENRIEVGNCFIGRGGRLLIGGSDVTPFSFITAFSIRVMISSASSARPTRSSHRGDSGSLVRQMIDMMAPITGISSATR